MSAPIMQAKPEEIDTPEKRGKHTVTVIGCEQIGIQQALLYAAAGFKVTCVDADQTLVNRISKPKIPMKSEAGTQLKSFVRNGRITATDNINEAILHSDIITITTPVRISSKRKAEYSDLENICKKIGAKIQNGSIIIIASLIGIGLIDGLIKETLENTSGLKAGLSFGLAYSPIFNLQGLTLNEEPDYQRIVAAADKNSLRAAALVLEKLSKNGVRKTVSLKSAEVAALLQALQRDIEIAVANESALLCEKAGVDYVEALRIMESNDGRQSAIMLVQDTIGDEPYLLLEEAEGFNLKPRIATSARQTNEERHKHLANLVKEGLKSCGKTVKRARIALLGVTQVPNSQAPLKKLAKELIGTLEARGAKISVYDPYLAENEISGSACQFKKNLTEALDRADCAVILTAHDNFKHMNLRKMKLTMKMPAAIIDSGATAEPSKIENEGFIYRGLGRGVWTK